MAGPPPDPGDERGELVWGLVLDSPVFTAEAEIRWLDHCESRPRRAAVDRKPAGQDPQGRLVSTSSTDSQTEAHR